MWVTSSQVVEANKKRRISFLRATLRYERECLYSVKKKLDNELGKCGND